MADAERKLIEAGRCALVASHSVKRQEADSCVDVCTEESIQLCFVRKGQ